MTNIKQKCCLIRKWPKIWRHITEQDMQMANNSRKKSSTFSIRDMQIKTTIRHHSATIIITKKWQFQMLARIRRNWITYCWWEYKLVKPLWKIVWVLKEQSKHLSYNLAILLLGIQSREMKIYVCKTLYIYFNSSFLFNIQKQEAVKRFLSGWIGKQIAIHLYHRLLLWNTRKKTTDIHNLEFSGHYSAWKKKRVYQSHILYDSTYVILSKQQNYRDEETSVCQKLGMVRERRWVWV